MSKLTIQDVNQLRVILEAAEQSAKVTFIPPGEIVKIRTGTARHIVRGPLPSEWYFPSSDYDVRDCYLRITMSDGFDTCFPVRQLMEVVERGEFVIDRDASVR